MTQSIAITPIGSFHATLRLPGSKSLTNRALLLAALAEGKSVLRNCLDAQDTRIMLAGLRGLGLLPHRDGEGTVTLEGRGGDVPVHSAVLLLGNAGTAFRFLTAGCCLGQGDFVLDGIARMRQRPIAQLVEALESLGARIEYLAQSGYPPLRIHGRGLKGGSLDMPVTLSSQYISALLQVGPYCKKGLTLLFKDPITSRPYVDMTLALMTRFGVGFEADHDFRRIHVPPAKYRGSDYAIEPDASNASYFLAAAAISADGAGSKCTIEGLGKGSLQGDVGFADVLHQMGAGVVFGRDFVTVMSPPSGGKLRGIDVDLNAMPDMAQTLAVVALFAEGPTTIRNIGNLRVKETDRLAALQTELSKFGAAVTIEGDDLFIEPPPEGRTAAGRLTPPASGIDTYDDHRMAMSFAVAGLRVPGLLINDPRCVDKTFPGFFEYLGRLGAAPSRE